MHIEMIIIYAVHALMRTIFDRTASFRIMPPILYKAFTSVGTVFIEQMQSSAEYGWYLRALRVFLWCAKNYDSTARPAHYQPDVFHSSSNRNPFLTQMSDME